MRASEKAQTTVRFLPLAVCKPGSNQASIQLAVQKRNQKRLQIDYSRILYPHNSGLRYVYITVSGALWWKTQQAIKSS